MSFKPKNKPSLQSYEEILIKKLEEGKKPTRAVEMALEEYNNSHDLEEEICIKTAWNRYKKVKERVNY